MLANIWATIFLQLYVLLAFPFGKKVLMNERFTAPFLAEEWCRQFYSAPIDFSAFACRQR